jgi:hypothetical protein
MGDLYYSQLIRRQDELMSQMVEVLGVDPVVAGTVDGGVAWREGAHQMHFLFQWAALFRVAGRGGPDWKRGGVLPKYTSCRNATPWS